MKLTKKFKTIDFDQVNEFGHLKRTGFAGFAGIYLKRCDKESKSDGEIDIQVYTQLVELDSRLGTTAAEQLFVCVAYTQRLDLIKV